MRRGWRNLFVVLALLLLVGGPGGPVSGAIRLGDSAPRGGDRVVRIAVEIAWTTVAAADGGSPDVEFEVSDGRVLDALSWPGSGAAGAGPRAREERVWWLGADRAGRVRAQVEVPVGASLILRAGGQMMRFPVALVLEGRQSSPAQAPVEVSIERLPWDAVGLKFLDQADATPPAAQADETKPISTSKSLQASGFVAPGSTVPVGVVLNVVTTEPGEVVVHGTAELRPLRGGEAVWTDEWREVMATDAAAPPIHPLNVKLPAGFEGLYVLEVRAAWEPTAPADASNGRLIGRLIRRGRRVVAVGPGAGNALRRATLVALAPREIEPVAAAKPDKPQEVDAFDLARMRANRPSAAGRAPLAQAGRSSWPLPDGALVEATRRDRLSGWMQRVGPEVAQLGPADGSGLAWSAVGLKVNRPGRPHRLTVAVTGGHPAALGVAVVGPPSRPATGLPTLLNAAEALGARPRLLLDACGSGPPILPAGPAATFSWVVWPDTPDPVLVLVNRGSATPVQVGTVSLTELPELPPAPAVETPSGAPARDLGLALTGPDVLERFGLAAMAGTRLPDPLTAARNLARYAAHCGATAVLLSDGLADRDRRRALDGQAAEDCLGPDRLDLTLAMLARQGLGGWLDLGLDGPLPGLPGPDTPEAAARGLVRLDRRGVVDGPSPAYHPLAPEVGRALERRITEAVARRVAAGNGLAGVVVRLGPGPTLLGAPDTGFDDATYDRFVRESFDGSTARSLPGVGTDDPGRYAARARFLGGSGRMPWLTWRSKQIAALYAGLATTADRAATGVRLAVVTPGLDDSPAATEARRADLAGLAPSLAWRAVGLDLAAWPSAVGDAAAMARIPAVVRGVSLGPDELAHDLATNPELDAEVAARPARGLLLDLDRPAGSDLGPGLALTALPLDIGPAGDEPLGHALAALDARWVWLAGPSAAGHEERLRAFARVLRSLPATPPTSAPVVAVAGAGTGAGQGGGAGQPAAATFGVAVRAYVAAGHTYVALANDTPFPVRLETILGAAPGATFDDLARGARLKPVADAAGHHVVLDLKPFGVSVVRVSAPDVAVASVVPYPSDAVRATLQARFDEVSAQLSRLSRKADVEATAGAAPLNGQFEPPAPVGGGGARAVALNVGTAAAPVGWQLKGGQGARLVVDPAGPHAGRGSLRFDAPQPPASVESDPFVLAAQPSLMVRAWLRADRPDARLRLWIEGASGGQPWRRVSELTAQPGWSERAVRAGDVPPAGLEDVRLRFELLTPGSLWVDDLSVGGGALSDPERRNARNTLLAAIQAYREKRYADFARLAGSRWARVGDATPSPLAPTAPGLAGGAAGGHAEGTPAADRGGMLRTGDASALPQGRRLR